MIWPHDLNADPRDTNALIFKSANMAPAEERREIFGEVLIPNERDLQGDIYSEETVRDAAYRWMARYDPTSSHGLQHGKRRLNSTDPSARQVELLESYVTIADLTINGRVIKKGTWVQRWKILDDALWAKAKSGLITGFSIGGRARVAD
jgi:hypothetical protein